MQAKASRKPFSDPFALISDEAFEMEVLNALDQTTTKISLRVPTELLGRTKHAAESRGVPYQSLMKALIDQGVKRLERTTVPAKSTKRTATVRSK